MASHAALAAAFVMACTATCLADPAGGVELYDTVYGFTSPGGDYGPRRFQTLVYHEQLHSDSLILTLLNRSEFNPSDSDRLEGQRAQSVTIEDDHDWSPVISTYLASGLASGTIDPTRSIDGAIEVKTLPSGSLGFDIGGGVARNPDQSTERHLSIGPTYDWKTGNASLLYQPSWVHPGSGGGSFHFEVNVGSDARTTSTLTMETGVVPPSLSGQALATSEEGVIDERAFVAELVTKHWMSRQVGWRFALDLGREEDRSTGAALYSWRGFSFGLIVATRRDPRDGRSW